MKRDPLSNYAGVVEGFSEVYDRMVGIKATDEWLTKKAESITLGFTGNASGNSFRDGFRNGRHWGPLVTQIGQELVLKNRQFRYLAQQSNDVPSLMDPLEQLRADLHKGLLDIVEQHYLPSCQDQIVEHHGLKPDKKTVEKYGYKLPLAKALRRHYGTETPEREEPVTRPTEQHIQQLLDAGVDLHDLRLAA